MTPEQKQRIEQIRERVQRLERAEKDPHVKTWDGAYYGDVHFLLSLVSQEAGPAIIHEPLNEAGERWDDDYGHDPKALTNLHRHDCLLVTHNGACDCPYGSVIQPAADRMRNACVETVKALPDHSAMCGVWLQQVCDCSFRAEVITALESVSIQEQEAKQS